MKPLLVLQAPIGTRSGYGDHSVDLALSLINSNQFDIQIIPTPWGNTPQNALRVDDEDHQKIIRHLMREPLKQQPDIFVQVTVPNEFQAIGKFNIGITAGIETTMCSAPWLEGMNRMNLVIVPSRHAKQVFDETVYEKRDQNGQAIGTLRCTVPIEVLHEGYDETIFSKLPSESLEGELVETLDAIPEEFAFLFVGHWLKGDIGQDRKDVGMLVKTFYETFSDTDNAPALILKTSQATFSIGDAEVIKANVAHIKNSVKKERIPNVYLLHGDLSRPEMNTLYNHNKVKALVSFTKGEGYGRPLLEFQAVGKPVVASKYSGHLDFLNPAFQTLLEGEVTQVHPSAVWKDVIIPESGWFTVNYSEASSKLSHMFRNYKGYYINAQKAMEEGSRKWTRTKMDEQFVQILEKYLPTTSKQVVLTLPKLKKV